MSNVTVQEALKAAIDCLDRNEEWDGQFQYDIQLCKAALAEIEKCEPVGYLPKSYELNILANSNDYPLGMIYSTKKKDDDLAVYTSPQPRDCEDWQYFDKAYMKATESSDATDWMNAALLAQQVRRIQQNTKG